MSKVNQAEDPNKTSHSTDEVSQPNASCPAACTITSQTVATLPSNRARTRVGAGEEVNLTVNPGPATWTATPNDLIEFLTKAKTANSIKIKALDKAGDVTITAKTGTCECSIILTIVLPTVFMMRIYPPRPDVMHVEGYPSCGWWGQPILPQNDVNFYNVWTRELDDIFIGSGAFKVTNGHYHGGYEDQKSDWWATQYNNTRGNEILMYDRIWSGFDPTANPQMKPPYTPGELRTVIRWQWTIYPIDEGKEHNYQITSQKSISDASGACTTTKTEYSRTANVDDPTTGFSYD